MRAYRAFFEALPNHTCVDFNLQCLMGPSIDASSKKLYFYFKMWIETNRPLFGQPSTSQDYLLFLLLQVDRSCLFNA
jgi:hypothetical protein